MSFLLLTFIDCPPPHLTPPVPNNSVILDLAAWETLGGPAKRKSFDSVDPNFDDSVPSVSSGSKENFFKVFRTYFEQNAR